MTQGQRVSNYPGALSLPRFIVEAGIEVPAGWRHITLRGGAGAPDVLSRHALSLPPRVLRGVRLTMTADVSMGLGVVATLPQSCIVVLEVTPTKQVARDLSKALRELDRPLWVHLTGMGEVGPVGVADLIKDVTALGIPMLLDSALLVEAPAQWTANIAEYYVSSPDLDIPIEPFHTAMALEAEVGRWNFWEVYRETAGRDFYVDGQGRVTLGLRWAARGLFYGDKSEGLEAWRRSELGQKQASYQKDIIRSGSPCNQCSAFSSCGGFLRAIDDQADCSGWIGAVALLHQKALDVKEQLAELRRSRTERDRRLQPESPRAPSVTLFVSKTCVNDCVFCATAASTGREADRYEDISSCIASLKSAKIESLDFSGSGEPTLNPRLGEYLALARDVGISNRCLLTNGHGATKENVAELVDKGLNSVVVSIHGLEASHDENVRRKGAFEEAHRAVRLYLDAGVKVSVRTCLTRRNLADISGLIVLIGGLEVTNHVLANPEWEGQVFANRDLLPTLPELWEFFDELDREHRQEIDLSPGSHVRVENVPDCVARKLVHLLGRQTGELLFRAEKRPLSRKLNLGRNTYPRMCGELMCPHRGHCAGVDQNYLEYYGSRELYPIAREFLRGSETHGPGRERPR